MKHISILGCGWLGLPLAEHLVQKKYSVNGSTTNSDKITELNNVGMKAFVIELKERFIKGQIELFLDKAELLIIAIPPKLRGDFSTSLEKTFVEKIQNLIPEIEKSSVTEVIFISSTSVYADDENVVTEQTIPNPQTESGKQLVKVEQLLLMNPNFKTIVLRFGGLVGDDRNPITSLSGKTNIENPDAPINLIHQEDCISIIEELIRQSALIEVWNETFNAVAPLHLSRREYYTQKAIERSLPLPLFEENNSSIGKTISSDKMVKFLKYKFKNSAL